MPTTRSSPSQPLRREAPAFGAEQPRHPGASFFGDDGTPLSWSPSADTDGVFSQMFELAAIVYKGTACDLPGVTIKYETFVPAMWKAVHGGHVKPQYAEYIQQTLR